MKFTAKVTVGISVALAVFALIGASSYDSALKSDENRKWVNHTHLVLEAVAALKGNVTDAEAGYRGFVLTQEGSYAHGYAVAQALAISNLQTLWDLTADNPVQQRNLAKLEPLVKERFGEIDRQIDAGIGNSDAPAPRFDARNIDEIRDLTLAMKQEEDRLLQRREESAQAASLRTRSVLIAGNLIAFIFLLFAGVIVRREMAGRWQAQEQINFLNQDLQRHVGDLTAMNNELDAFTYSLAHDLRAPLRHMHGFAELMRESSYDKLDEHGRRFLDKILLSSRQMGALIDDLLNFARLSRVELQTLDVDPRNLVERAQSELASDTSGRAITWEVAPLPGVRADPALLYQALFNLLANAVKYTRKCEAARIEVGSTVSDAGEVTIFVGDNGAGFDMRYADKLFKVFQRLHRASDFEGTGVGLANVRRIIERHGGRVWAEGAIGQGATFYFSLPAASTPTSQASISTPTSQAPTRRQDAEQARVHSVGR
jgi:signal transduction histidine kinase